MNENLNLPDICRIFELEQITLFMENLIKWTARLLTMLAVIFMGRFSLDVFSMDGSFSYRLIGFLVHNIPNFIFIIGLAVAWKNELMGGILILLCALGCSLYYGSFSGNSGSLIILAPFIISGLLFLTTHFVYKKSKTE